MKEFLEFREAFGGNTDVTFKFLRPGIFATLVLFGGVAHAGGFSLLLFDGRPVRWQHDNADASLHLTYAFLNGPTAVAGARNCQTMTGLDQLAENAAIPVGRLREDVAAAFRIWTKAANLQFREVRDPGAADILIGAQVTPRGIAFADVRVDTAAPGPDAIISGASICLNPLAPWTLEPDGASDTYSLPYVVAHEIGHTLGLDHPGRTGPLMAYAYQEHMIDLSDGDIAGITSIYGPATTRVAMHPDGTDVAVPGAQ